MGWMGVGFLDLLERFGIACVWRAGGWVYVGELGKTSRGLCFSFIFFLSLCSFLFYSHELKWNQLMKRRGRGEATVSRIADAGPSIHHHSHDECTSRRRSASQAEF